MKRTLSTLAGLSLLSFATYAQTEKGQGLLSGRVVVSRTNLSGMGRLTANSASVGVGWGRFVRDNWLVGGHISVAGNGSKATAGSSVDNTQGGLEGYVRRYWGENRWRVFLGGGLTAVYFRSEQYQRPTGTGAFDRFNQQNIDVNPLAQVGGMYALSNRVALEVSATASSFPVSFSGLGVGLVVLTGRSSGLTNDSVAAPQTQRGRWLIGGNVALNSSRNRTFRQVNAEPDITGETNSRQFELSPSVGWFIRDNTLLGLTPRFGHTRVRSATTDPTIGITYGTDLFVRRYVGTKRLRPFYGGRGSFSRMAYRSKDSEAGPFLIRNYGVGVSAGAAYLLGQRFLMEATLAELTVNRNSQGQQVAWSVDASAVTSPRFTVNYVFN